MKIDPLLRGQLPQIGHPEPCTFVDCGFSGWKISIPGNRPLATPAVVDGKVFLGGGFGSYHFFAFDAVTGRLAWQYQTEDDGPTAAIVFGDRVIFNTESCELEVLTMQGERVWKKWLGDPLLSMPAAEDDRIFIAYPDSRGDRQHYLAAFDLNSGNEIWRQPIPGELITCPVLEEGMVYASSLDGTISCFAQDTGSLIWQEAKNTTCAPTVWRSQCYFSLRGERRMPHTAGSGSQTTEFLASKLSGMGTPTYSFESTTQDADYLDHGKRSARSSHYHTQTMYDSTVGFSSHKGDSKIHQAMGNLGTGHVSGVWAFQGSRPFVWNGRLYSSMGDTVQCVDPETREVYWKRKLRDEADTSELLDTMLTPPAIVNGKLFVGTLDGRVLAISADQGDILWTTTVGEPVGFQVAVAEGRVYVPTMSGNLYAIETGEPADDGWLMWGASPAHNGMAEVAEELFATAST